MTLGFMVKIFLEMMVVLLIAYGIFNEEKLIAFEEELFPVLRFCFHKYFLKSHAGTKRTRAQRGQRIVRRRASVRVVSVNGCDITRDRYVA